MCGLDRDPTLPAPRIRWLWRTVVVGVLLWLSAGLAPPSANGQESRPPTSWNDARALELIARARVRRGLPLADSTLRDYRAAGRGMVYFYLDSEDLREKVLVKTDQVALEVLWAQPDRAKQRIVGMRDESKLPNRMYYHLDHLTVVQNGFGDVIRMGDGDEVRDVRHPAASGADTIYDYRLADSLTIRLPGRPEPVQAYEVQVRPRHTDRSALIGSVFVDRETADIVRMTFTFTPASYVDPRLDYINISLDNSLWDGRYWLPHEQAVEIRRQVPELDYAAGAVILARFRVTDYEFNVGLSESAFQGYQVTTVPRAERESFPFETGLYEDLHERGLAPPTEMGAVQREAAALIGRMDLSGLPRWRLSIPNPSSALRYDRAEGVFIGAGVVYVPGPEHRLRLQAGHAFSGERGTVQVAARMPLGFSSTVGLDAGWNELRDMGFREGVPGSLNTLAAAFGEDYLDPFHASAVSLEILRPFGSWTANLRLFGERHRPAERVVGSGLFGAEFREVRRVARGDLIGAQLGLGRAVGETGASAWGGSFALEAASFDGAAFLRPTADLAWVGRSVERSVDLRIRFATGVALQPPPQRLFLLGGVNTLPGYDYRGFVGDAFALVDAEVTRDLWRPWVRGRLLAAAGWSDLLWFDDIADDPMAAGPLPTRDWNARVTGGIRPSLGIGVGIFFDILRIDLARGLDGGSWQFLLSVHPDLWPIL
jgi:hypothetical protein